MENRQPAYPGTTVPGLRTPSAITPSGPRRRLPRPGAPAAAGLLTAAALALTACGGPATGTADPAGEPRRGGTLTYATGDVEPACLDPIVSGNVPQALVSTQYLEPLFHQDEDGEIGPWLAESWKWSSDRLALDITVRDDVSFTDGQQLNAETIQKNVEYIKDPKTLSSTGILAVEKVESVELVDEFTARLHLSEPDNALLEHFAQVWVPIQSQKALARGMEQNCLAPVGTGPFTVHSWTKQREIVLVRNEDYHTPAPTAGHSGPAYLDRIVWRFLPDHANRFSALQAGEVDVIDVIQPQDAIAADADPALDTLIGSRPGHVVNLTFNTRREPFADLRVREALIRSVDVDAALKSIFLGTVDRSDSVLSSITKYNHQQPEVFATDVEKANRLLDEAGWTGRDAAGYRTKNGRRLSATVLQTESVLVPVSVLEQFQASAKAVGFELLISQEETSTFNERRYAWDYDLAPMYYTKNSPAVLNLTHHRDNIPSVIEGGYHANNNGLQGPEAERIDQLLDTGSVTADEQERHDSYVGAQDVLHSQYLNLPIFDQQTRLGFRSDVEGLQLISPLGMPTFYDTWLDRS
ncbi:MULTISPECIES: ABC transporter substrate-binding protein [Citricoccus]|uniref:ABC transporter substrate-binding protein n=1 Tax=Citricoccus TaxID=169133 RepID=UPI000255E13D|nr:ABC transporter substrate-binding protein [Citricoccus sp. CH26A]